MAIQLDILYKDDHLVAVNKPHGLLVHRSPIAKDATVFALQVLREQLGRHVYPAHRLDRKTGGVLLFALSAETVGLAQQAFAQQTVQKTYLAMVRGFSEAQGEIDYALAAEAGKPKPAITRYRTLARAELAVPFGKHATSRYSLVEAMPQTGRMHQIRKHFAHIHHPIIADRPHGCNKQNRLFKSRWRMDTMMLHAAKLALPHPITGEMLALQAPVHAEFARMGALMGWQNHLRGFFQ